MKSVGVITFFAITLVQVNLARAEDQPSQVIVDVRTVRAENRLNGADEQANPSIDSHLQDLRDKLERLPFRQFRIVGSERVKLPLKRKGTLVLVGGQTLTIRPLYMENEKVGLWFKWLDSQGTQILDTRMHVVPGESFLAGTDITDNESSSDNGVILAIGVSPAQ